MILSLARERYFITTSHEIPCRVCSKKNKSFLPIHNLLSERVYICSIKCFKKINLLPNINEKWVLNDND
jgi:hypothetical protein